MYLIKIYNNPKTREQLGNFRVYGHFTIAECIQASNLPTIDITSFGG